MSYGGAAAGVMALVLALKRRQAVQAFQAVGATSAATALERPELGLRDSRLFRRLLRRGVVCEASPGFFYLDTNVLAREARRRRTVLGLVLVVALIGLIVVWWLEAGGSR